MDKSAQINLDIAKKHFGNHITSDDIRQVATNERAVEGVPQNKLPHFTALNQMMYHQKSYERNVSAIDSVVSKVEKSQTYSPSTQDQLLMMNLTLLTQDDPGLQKVLSNRGVETFSANLMIIKESINQFASTFNIPILGSDSLVEGKDSYNASNAFVTYNGSKMSLSEFIQNVNTATYGKYFSFKNDVLTFNSPVYFDNINEMSKFSAGIAEFVSILKSVKTVDGKLDENCRKINNSKMIKNLEAVSNDVRRVLSIASPGYINELESQYKDRHILLLQSNIIKMNEEFTKTLEKQFELISSLVKKNSDKLGDEISKQYQAQLELIQSQMSKQKEDLL
jgi:hypothetical protein